EVLHVRRVRAVAPAYLPVLLVLFGGPVRRPRTPFESAGFGDEVGLSPIGNGDRVFLAAVCITLVFGQAAVMPAQLLQALRKIGLHDIVVRVIDVGFRDAVRVTGGVQDGAGRIHRLGREEEGAGG